VNTPPAASTTTTTVPAPRAELELTTAEDDSRYHNYVGHQIPWYVRLIWIIFWCFAAWYVIRLMLPALDTELLAPP
jgi:hypothetical protein